MAGKVLNKMMGFLGLEDDNEDELEESNERHYKENNENSTCETEPVISGSKKQNKVVSIHSASTAKVKIVKPLEYEDAADICEDFKNRKIVVVNTSNLEAKVAQRLLDFISGASYVLDGGLEEIEKGVYILSPSNVEVTNELKSELSNKGIFSWSK